MPTVTYRSPAPANLLTKPVVYSAVALAMGFSAIKYTIMGGDPAKSGDNVPAATMSYLEGLQPKPGVVPEGEGVDAAALAVDHGRYDMSANVHAGIRELLNAQTPGGDGIPQAGEKLEVPFIPPGTHPPKGAL